MIEWAEQELNRLLKDADKEEYFYQKRINDNILEFVKVFSNQDHSGLSSLYVIGLLNRLLKHKPITPLTGDDDEWSKPFKSYEDVTQQNKRCSAVFRHNYDNSTAHYIDGKVFSDDGGKTWFTNKDSFVNVTFPFDVPEEPERIILK